MFVSCESFSVAPDLVPRAFELVEGLARCLCRKTDILWLVKTAGCGAERTRHVPRRQARAGRETRVDTCVGRSVVEGGGERRGNCGHTFRSPVYNHLYKQPQQRATFVTNTTLTDAPHTVRTVGHSARPSLSPPSSSSLLSSVVPSSVPMSASSMASSSSSVSLAESSLKSASLPAR